MKTKIHWRELKALHAQGLNDEEIAALHNCTARYVGQTRASLGLPSNNRRATQKGEKRNGNP